MKKKERKALLVLVLIAAVVIAIIYFATRNKNGRTTEAQQQTQTQTQPQTAQQAQVVEEPKRERDESLVQTAGDGSEVNTSEAVKEEREVDGFKLSNITLTKTNYGTTVMEASVTNETGSDQSDMNIDIVLYDRKGNEIGRIPGYIMETVAGQTITMRNEITDDFVDAYDMKIEVK